MWAGQPQLQALRKRASRKESTHPFRDGGGVKELLNIPGTELVQHMLFETNSVAVMLVLISER